MAFRLLWASSPRWLSFALWAWYGAHPGETPSVSEQELAKSAPTCEQGLRRRFAVVHSSISLKAAARLSETHLLRFASPTCALNYTFYLLSNVCFLYLVHDASFSCWKSGWLATAPPLPTALGAGVGGMLTASFAGVSASVLRLLRLVPLVAMPAAACCCCIAVQREQSIPRGVALATASGASTTEGAFWAA